ncbi:Hypothetical protein (Fragment) [Durusdinium trenchii]|uniref:Uncharacterized protein n=1 Tax=Durusdinium trenchii TaxID=1381693 RepID=A0ABP0QLG9_9DINO
MAVLLQREFHALARLLPSGDVPQLDCWNGAQRLFEKVRSWELSVVSGVFIAFFTLILNEVDSVQMDNAREGYRAVRDQILSLGLTNLTEFHLDNRRLQLSRLRHCWTATVAAEQQRDGTSPTPLALDEDECLLAAHAGIRELFWTRYRLVFPAEDRLRTKAQRALQKRSLEVMDVWQVSACMETLDRAGRGEWAHRAGLALGGPRLLFNGPVGKRCNPSILQLTVRLMSSISPQSIEAEVIAAGKGCCLVDCFGLGTVDYSLRAARLQTWAPLLQGFVSERRALGMVCHLVSCEQQGQLSEGDEQLVEIFQKCEKERVRRQIAPFRYVVILTKTDLASSPADVERFAEQVGARLKEMGQTVWKIVTCTSMSEDGSGIREVAEIIDEAKKEWIEDAFLTPRPPGGKTTTQRRELRNNFTQSRRVSSRHPPRGGPGAKTMLPPRV